MRLIPLSALQHYAFCPRQCALIHNEQAWAENYLTAQGKALHERVDSGEPETALVLLIKTQTKWQILFCTLLTYTRTISNRGQIL